MNTRLPSLIPFSLLVGASLVAAATSGFAADPLPPAGRLLASQCFQCHVPNGGESVGFESIAGLEASEVISEMTEMKNKRTPETIMDRQAKGYTDVQIRQIAAYLATLKPAP